jgi:hypothetical protein
MLQLKRWGNRDTFHPQTAAENLGGEDFMKNDFPVGSAYGSHSDTSRLNYPPNYLARPP